MKKILIPTLLIIALFAGCERKGENTGKDSTGGHTPPHIYTGVGGQPTTSITPPAVVGGKAGALQIIMPGNANSVLISVIFAGSNQTQTVTVANGSSVLMRLPYSGGWTSFVVPPSTSQQDTISITDSIGTTLAPFPKCGSSPVASGTNIQGFDATTYSDNSTPVNKTVVVVTDLCGQF